MSFDSYNFDFGLGSTSRTNSSRPLRDQKPNATPSNMGSTPTSTWSHKPASTPSWTHQPASSKPSWTHQPSAPIGSGGATSMAGDIFGKTWSSSTTTSTSNLGIPQSKNSNHWRPTSSAPLLVTLPPMHH